MLLSQLNSFILFSVAWFFFILLHVCDVTAAVTIFIWFNFIYFYYFRVVMSLVTFSYFKYVLSICGCIILLFYFTFVMALCCGHFIFYLSIFNIFLVQWRFPAYVFLNRCMFAWKVKWAPSRCFYFHRYLYLLVGHLETPLPPLKKRPLKSSKYLPTKPLLTIYKMNTKIYLSSPSPITPLKVKLRT